MAPVRARPPSAREATLREDCHESHCNPRRTKHWRWPHPVEYGLGRPHGRPYGRKIHGWIVAEPFQAGPVGIQHIDVDIVVTVAREGDSCALDDQSGKPPLSG